MSDDRVFTALIDINKSVGKLHGKVDGMKDEIQDLKVDVNTCQYERQWVDMRKSVDRNTKDILGINKTIWKWGGAIGAFIVIVNVLVALFS